jgi:hypothetical protein
MNNRDYLIGLDKRSARPLNAYTHPEQALRNQALTHEKHRLEAVAETLALVGLMAVKQVLRGNEVVVVKGGAVFQFGKGVEEHATVGAHCLPGRLNFNNAHLHEMVEWRPEVIQQRGMKPLPLSSKLRNLFAWVDVFDRSINNADSWVEKLTDERGLKPLFGRTVQRSMREVALRKPPTGRGLRELVKQGFEDYKFNAGYIYEERLDRLIHPPSSVKPGEHDANRKLIVEHYLTVLCHPSFMPEALTPPGFSDLIRDVLAEGAQMISRGTDAFQA